MAQVEYMRTRLDRTAEKIARDPKAVVRARRSFAAMREGNSVDAFQVLADVRDEKLKAKKHNAR